MRRPPTVRHAAEVSTCASSRTEEDATLLTATKDIDIREAAVLAKLVLS